MSAAKRIEGRRLFWQKRHQRALDALAVATDVSRAAPTDTAPRIVLDDGEPGDDAQTIWRRAHD